MIYSKKGVSTIVANVLIVLLVIVGVAVIWAVVNPTLEKSAQGVKAADCFNLRLSPSACTFGVSATVGRSAGAGKITNVKLIFENTLGVKYVSTQAVATGQLDELESKTYDAITEIIVPSPQNDMPANFLSTITGTPPVTVDHKPIKFNVAAEIGPAGNTIVCEPLSQPINCV